MKNKYHRSVILDLACKNYYNYRNVYCNKLLKASIYNKN